MRPSELLAALRGEVLDACAREGVSNVRVFGSVARGADHEDSDIDLLVTFPPETGLFKLYRLEEELTRILTVPVDLVGDEGEGRVLERALAEAVKV